MLAKPNNVKFPMIHISGCPNNCGQHSTAELGFFGAAKRVNGRLVPYYNVVMGNGKNELSKTVGILPAKNIPLMLKEAGFMEDIPGLIKKFQTVPDYDAEPSFYKDWSSDEDFSLAGRAPGECGAGVLELIDFDLNEAVANLRIGKFYESILSAARSLLVIRGIDTTVDREIFDGFRKELINSGYVEESSGEVIDAAIDSKLSGSDLSSYEDRIAALIERCKILKGSLDKNLNFKLPPLIKKSDIDDEGKSNGRLDLSGVKCPINFVMAKVELEKIPIGETLEVILDDGDPIRNVPESFRNQGQKVIKVEHLKGKSNLMVVKRIK